MTHPQLSELILRLKYPVVNDDFRIDNITYLIESLEELQGMIGMASVKGMITKLIKVVLTDEKIKDTMLNFAIFGPPGSGKTTVAKILGKIVSCLGILKSVGTSSSDGNLDPEYIKEKLTKYRRLVCTLRKHKSEGDLPSIGDSPVLDPEMSDALILRKLDRGLYKLIHDMHPMKNNVVFVQTTRDQLVGEYIGHTAVKTRKILESARGGVLFIDEAYSLYTGKGDTFGEECLNTINQYLSEHPDEICLIFSGYKDKTVESLFKLQPGLPRRLKWIFEVDEYTTEELVMIFKVQANGWEFNCGDIELIEIFEKNKKLLSDGGGSTETLLFYCFLLYCEMKFDSEEADFVKEINLKILESAFECLKMKENKDKILDKDKDDKDDKDKKEFEPWMNMYS